MTGVFLKASVMCMATGVFLAIFMGMDRVMFFFHYYICVKIDLYSQYCRHVHRVLEIHYNGHRQRSLLRQSGPKKPFLRE
jgi:hypothetical protein